MEGRLGSTVVLGLALPEVRPSAFAPSAISLPSFPGWFGWTLVAAAVELRLAGAFASFGVTATLERRTSTLALVAGWPVGCLAGGLRGSALAMPTTIVPSSRLPVETTGTPEENGFWFFGGYLVCAGTGFRGSGYRRRVEGWGWCRYSWIFGAGLA